MKESDVDLLVLQYLKKKGYTKALDALRADAQVQLPTDEEGGSLQQQLGGLPGSLGPLASSQAAEQQGGGAGVGGAGGADDDDIVHRLLFVTAADSEPQAYLDSYERLSNWVDNSLDMYRGELSRVLFPVFVHIYLLLVDCNAGQLAAELMRRHRRRLDGGGSGGGSSARSQELSELAGVVAPQQLRSSAFVAAARAEQPVVRLSSQCWELLMRFLQGGCLWLLLGVINQHITFDVVEGAPRPAPAGESGEEECAGLLQRQGGRYGGGSVNNKPLHLGLLRGEPEDAFVLRLLAEEEAKLARSGAAGGAGGGEGGEEGGGGAGAGEAEAEAEGGGAAQPASKRQRVAREKAVAALAAQSKAIQDARLEPWIPLLPTSDTTRRAMAEHVAVRTPATPSDLPSCCFFTVVNEHSGMCCAAFSPDAERVAVGCADAAVRLYDLAALARQRGSAAVRLRQRGARAARRRGDAARSSGGGGGAGVGGGGAAQEVDAGVDDEPEELEAELEAAAGTSVAALWGHSSCVTGLDFLAPDAATLLSCSADGSCRAWSVELGRPLAAYRGHVLPVWDVAAAPSGAYFASAGADRTARVWVAEAVRTLRVFAGHTGDVDVVRWHPNSHYVATGSSDRSVRLWDVASGGCVRLLTAHAGCPTALAFSADGATLAAGMDDGAIAVYDLGSAKRVSLLQGHAGPVWSLGFSHRAVGPAGSSGALLASGGADETVRLWSVPADEGSMLALLGEGGDVLAAAAAVGSTGAPAAPAPVPPYQLLRTYRTRATPVAACSFTPRNLLLAAGPLTLRC